MDYAHHIAWLAAHPNRSAEWLKARLKDGFDVHHIDGNRANNDPRNLILIEAADHMLVHTGHRFLRPPLKRTRPDAYIGKYGVSADQIAEWRAKSRLL